jgi:biopolymer transport protein ExbD
MAEIQQGEAKGKGGKPQAKKMSTHIDMTPMVDLAFLLLTFFMLATTFSKPRAMEIAMPMEENQPQDAPELDDQDAFTILLGENDKVVYYIGLTDKAQPMISSLDPDGLRKELLKKKNERPKLMVLIKPSPSANYKTVVDVFDEMNVTKMPRYAMLDITPAEQKLLDETK